MLGRRPGYRAVVLTCWLLVRQPRTANYMNSLITNQPITKLTNPPENVKAHSAR